MIKKDRLLKTFLDLVQIDSPSGSEEKMAKEVSKRLKALGFKVERDKFGNVIGKLPGEGEPLMLNAHLDTVEPGRGIKPIIEGDIIKTDGGALGEVKWRHFGFEQDMINTLGWWLIQEDGEIIGNIYDNSELLKT